jgi:hypothetical protein
MLGAAVFIPWAARNHRLALVVDVRWQQGASGGPGRAAELRLNGLAQVLQNMEAVGDLPRLRRAFTCALGERTAAIAADHLDVRMSLEPVRCRAGLRVGTALTEATANFLVNRRMNKSQQMRWTRRGADLLLQVRSAVYNGTLGTVSGQRFAPDLGLPPQITMAA